MQQYFAVKLVYLFIYINYMELKGCSLLFDVLDLMKFILELL